MSDTNTDLLILSLDIRPREVIDTLFLSSSYTTYPESSIHLSLQAFHLLTFLYYAVTHSESSSECSEKLTVDQKMERALLFVLIFYKHHCQAEDRVSISKASQHLWEQTVVASLLIKLDEGVSIEV